MRWVSLLLFLSPSVNARFLSGVRIAQSVVCVMFGGQLFCPMYSVQFVQCICLRFTAFNYHFCTCIKPFRKKNKTLDKIEHYKHFLPKQNIVCRSTVTDFYKRNKKYTNRKNESNILSCFIYDE